MPAVPHPGVSEQGWLADLKETAEQVGTSVFGAAIRWDVEGLTSGSGRRPDVVVRWDTSGDVVATGEAKRPDVPEGAHPLVASEVRDAIEKAQMHGAALCFTTNFFESAVFDASAQTYATDLDRLQGNLIPLISQGVATAADWWSVLPSSDRARLTIVGLRQLFERLRQSSRETVARDINEITLHVFTRVTDRLLHPLFESFIAERDGGQIPGEVVSHALQVHLNPADDGEARFLVAQGIAEVLTATLFYRNICDHFSLGPLLAGTSPRTSSVLVTRLGQSFDRAIHDSGDYETIFKLSPAAQWTLSHGGAPVLHQWKDLFDFTKVTSDVIGSIFERLISPERRHAMGQHYTDARVARSMILWAVRSPDDTVADVACGAGTFLVEAWKRFAADGVPHAHILDRVYGNDLDPFAVHLAMVNMATREIYRGANYPAIRLGDAFDVRPGGAIQHITPSIGNPVDIVWPADGCDAVVGNPPYAVKAEDPDGLRRALNGLGSPAPANMGGNLAAWFGLLAAALTKNTGRWALVLPTAVLQNTNLIPWRDWLQRNFDAVIWHTEDDVWFSDARVATCVILAQRASSANPSLHFVDIRERIQGELAVIGIVPSPTINATVRDLSALPAAEDILVAGTIPDVLVRFGDSAAVRPIGRLDGVTAFSGNKLGHAIYQLRDLTPNRTGVLRDLEGFRMRLRLNKSYLLPFLRSPMDERTGEFTTSDYWVLNAPETIPSSGALRSYVNHGRGLSVHRQASIAQRGQHWWNVEWRASQVAVQIHPGFLHQVWWSKEAFVAKNNFHVLAFDSSVPQANRELIAASLASAFGALAALYVSSEVGNEGVRWLSTEQFAQWFVLDPAVAPRVEQSAVLRSYRLFRQLQAQEIHQMDQATMAAWHELTARVARAAGLSSPDVVATEVIELARRTCVRRADREALALSGRMRSSVRRGNFARHVQERLEASPRVGPLLEELTDGARVIRLRPAAVLLQGTFDFGDDSAPDLPVEQSLSAVLGAGFECAPIASEPPDKLANDIATLLDDLVVDLVGRQPTGLETSATHREIASEVRRTAIAWLQQRVNNRLH